jgi:hypothetical protein
LDLTLSHAVLQVRDAEASLPLALFITVLSVVTVNAESKGEDWLCEVGVDHAGQHTRHTVTVRRADLERWAGGTEREDVEKLVSRSFDFLLEREPPNAILATFDLSVIRRYFPEYDAAFLR